VVSILGAIAFVAGCSDSDSARQADVPIPDAKPQNSSASPGGVGHAGSGSKILASGPFEKKFDGILFSVPAGWNEVELSPQQQGFIDARFEIVTPHGNVMLTCSSNAGGIETNVQRWIGQFQMSAGEKPEVEHLDVGGKSATWVDLHGEFSVGPMTMSAPSSGPIERMLGVAIPLGSRDFYLKLTGTNAAVSDVRSAFRQFVRDARVGR